jgi:hypothetical protein
MPQRDYLSFERTPRSEEVQEDPPKQIEKLEHPAFFARFGRSGQADGICGRTAGFVAETKPRRAPGETVAILIRTSGRFSKIPSCRTPPLRPPSATAAQTVALCTSNPTYVISSIRPVPMQEALCRPSGTTLDIVHAEDGPPITQRTSGLVATCRCFRNNLGHRSNYDE